MKVRLLVARAGDRFSQIAGDVIELDKEEASRLVDRGQAEPVGPETGSLEPPRNAAKPRAHARKAK